MQIQTTSTMCGANLYADSSVIRIKVAPDNDRESLQQRISIAAIPDILHYLPGLEKSLSEKEISVRRLFEHVCVELQNLTGASLDNYGLKDGGKNFRQ